MTQAVSHDNNLSSLPSINRKGTQKKALDVEVIRALTPLFIAGVGGLIGIVLLGVMFFKPDLDTAKFTAATGLATTAITGAAGLAQPGRGNGSEKPKTSQEEIDQAR